jgi:hypothetical protein
MMGLLLHVFALLGAFFAVLRTQGRFLLRYLGVDLAHNPLKLSLLIL